MKLWKIILLCLVWLIGASSTEKMSMREGQRKAVQGEWMIYPDTTIVNDTIIEWRKIK